MSIPQNADVDAMRLRLQVAFYLCNLCKWIQFYVNTFTFLPNDRVAHIFLYFFKYLILDLRALNVPNYSENIRKDICIYKFKIALKLFKINPGNS